MIVFKQLCPFLFSMNRHREPSAVAFVLRGEAISSLQFQKIASSPGGS